MSVNKIPIPGMLKSSVPDGYVVGAEDVLDSNLDKDQQTINEEMQALILSEASKSSKFIPLTTILEESVYVEQTSLAGREEGASYAYVWDSINNRLLMRVLTEDHIQSADYEYYMSWNDQITGIASNDIDKFSDFFYTTTEDLLTIWHWSNQAGTIVPTDSSTRDGGDEGGGDEGGDDDHHPFDPDEDPLPPVDPDVPSPDYDFSSDPAYPEYYGAYGDGIDYYNWPLACYNGVIDDDVTIESNASTIEVYAPAERTYWKFTLNTDYYGKSLDYTTDNVLFSSVNNKFLLFANNKYYDSWANSDKWNDSITGKAREDTVFSNIKELTVQEKSNLDADDKYGLAKRITSVYVSGEGLVDIGTTMHNDGPAMTSWFNANKGEGKVARLAPGKIYYINSVDDNTSWTTGSTMFKVPVKTTIIGNGAVLFPRMTGTGWPPKRGYLYEASNAKMCNLFHFDNGGTNTTIQNLKIMALRDKDAGAPNSASYNRFSSSGSSINAFVCTNKAISGISLYNITLKNIDAPMDFRRGTGFSIIGMTADGVVNNGFGLTDSVYDNVHMTMAPMIGSGMHIFYGGNYTSNVVVKNSTFKAIDPYTEVLFTFHAKSTSDNPAVGETHDVWFKNCTFEGGGPMFGGDTLSGGRCWYHFEGCTLKRKFDKFMSHSDQGLVDSNYIINEKSSSWEFKDCEIYTREGVFMVKSSSPHGLIFDGVNIHSTRTTQSNKYLVGRDAAFNGNITVSNFWTNYLGPLGFTLPDDGSSQDDSGSGTSAEVMEMLETMRTDIGRISTVVDGVYATLNGTGDDNIPSAASAPSSPSVGDKYYNTTDGKTYECTTVGKPILLSYKLNPSFAGTLPSGNKQTITINDGETIEFDFTGATTYAEVVEIIETTLQSEGYTEATFNSTTRTPGKYTIVPDGNNRFLVLTSKSNGDYDSPALSTAENSSYPIIKLNIVLSDGEWRQRYSSDCYHGIDAVWEETTGSVGLIQLVSSIAERLTTLEGQTRYIGQRTLTQEEMEEAGLDDNGEGSGTPTEVMGP